MKAKYGWIVTKLSDASGLWTDEDKERIENQLGVNAEQYTLCDPKTKVKWRVRDDDGINYADGWLWGGWEGFEPLDDWAMPSLGCTSLWLYSKDGWSQAV